MWRLEQGQLPTQRARLAPLFNSGALRVAHGATYDLDDLADALRDIEQRRATGKPTITIR